MRALSDLSEEEIVKRLPVWTCLSDSFLDTEFNESHYRAVARRLSVSGFSEEELEAIFRQEVAPVFASNLLGVAGVWDGWSEEEVRALMLDPSRNIGGKIASKTQLARYIDEEWDRIRKAIHLG